MIRIGIAELALNRAVSDTAEVIATHAYPAALVASKGKNSLDTFIQNRTMGVLDLRQATEIFQDTFGSVDVNFSPKPFLAQLAKEHFLTPMVREKFEASFVGDLLAVEKLKVVDVEVTNGFFGGIVMTAQYKMNLVAPFVDREIVLKKRAYEKFWVPTS
ncbi:MAG TPA: hypothetical protein VFT51_10450 [Bacillales bacterium]|nr:hypothetical protein [Bacillales bacterium]